MVIEAILVAVLIIALALSATALTRSTKSISRQRRAERELLDRLRIREDFVNAVKDYLESIDRDGVPDPEAVERMRRIIEVQLRQVAKATSGDREILGALEQPSRKGQLKYTEKLADEALRRLNREESASPT